PRIPCDTVSPPARSCRKRNSDRYPLGPVSRQRCDSTGAARGLFSVTRRSFASRELRQDVGGTETVPRKQHQTMKPQIGHFGRNTDFITVLRGPSRLGRPPPH